MLFSKRLPIWILGIVIALVAIRLALPIAIKYVVNKKLNEIPGYYGSVADIDLSLWRGAYQIDGIRFVKLNGKESEPLFSADEIDISVDWNAVLHRRLVSRITMFEPKLQFVIRPSKEASQTKVDSSWQDKAKSLVPFQINRFLIYDGVVRYKDETRKPKIDVDLHHLDLEADNISNAAGSDDRLPSRLVATARAMKTGHIKLDSKMDLFSKPAAFDMKASVVGLDLKEVNEFTKAYGNFDFEKGTLRVTMELAATKDKIDGYVKTLAKDVKVLDVQKEIKEGDSAGHILWEGIVGGIMAIFKNHPRDQFATKVPISGNRADMKIGTWPAIESILKNTFVKALSPKYEDTVSYETAKKAPPEGK